MAVSETIQTTGVPSYISDRQQQLLNTMFGPQGQPGGLMGQPLTVPGQQVAGFTPTQQAGMQLAGQGIGAYQPYLDAATAGMTAGLGTIGAGAQTLAGAQYEPTAERMKQFMDPYQQQVTQEAMKEMDRQAQMQRNQLGAQATQAGAFGGSRFGVQQAEQGRNLQDIKSRRIFEDMSRNYQQALGAMQTANQQQLQQGQAFGQLGQVTSGIAGQMQGLGGAAQAMGQSDVNQLMGIGGMQQQLAQAGMTTDYQNQLALANAPFQALSSGAGILQQLSPQMVGSQTTAPLPQSNPWMSGIGTAGSLYGMSQGLSSLIG